MQIMESPDNWDDLTKSLWKESYDAKTKRHKPYIAFRGMSENYPLETGIQRLHKRGISLPLSKDELARRERKLIDNFRKYAYKNLSHNASDWEVLLLAQHYRLPTRLLDWTHSPYIALFFAVENTEKWEEDGIIWCVKRLKSNSYLPSQFKNLLNEQNTTFSLQTLEANFPSLDDFDRIPTNALIWFEPPSLDARIVNQYALFSVMPGIENSYIDYFNAYPAVGWGVTVPKDLKPEIYDRLSIMNLTHRVIYPGLEGIAKWLRSYYGT